MANIDAADNGDEPVNPVPRQFSQAAAIDFHKPLNDLRRTWSSGTQTQSKTLVSSLNGNKGSRMQLKNVFGCVVDLAFTFDSWNILQYFLISPYVLRSAGAPSSKCEESWTQKTQGKVDPWAPIPWIRLRNFWSPPKNNLHPVRLRFNNPKQADSSS